MNPTIRIVADRKTWKKCTIRINCKDSIEILKKYPKLFKLVKESSRYSYFEAMGEVGEVHDLYKEIISSELLKQAALELQRNIYNPTRKE